MPHLSWNEIRDRAMAFASEWQAATSESSDKQTFWNEFFKVFGTERRTVATFEVGVRNLAGRFNHIDLLWKGMLLVEHKSAGKSLAAAESQAFDYIQDLIREGRGDEIPRYVIVSDFRRIALYDLEPDEKQNLPEFSGRPYGVIDFALPEFYKHARSFAFIKGERPVRLDPEDPANQKAYDKMCLLHDELEQSKLPAQDLERLLVRLLFCLFAEDTGIFEPNAFQAFIHNHTREDGSDLGARLNELFEVLNTPEESRARNLNEDLAAFPYVNGQLFAERLGFATFSRGMRTALLHAAEFQWARISPAVFGSLFQGILDSRERRQQGAHYTSERDIMKVIRSLFLDNLRAEFETIRTDKSKRRMARLDEFQKKLRTLHFLDPACGCGNFLILAYREVRALELDVLRDRYAKDRQNVLNVRDLILVDVDQFYGIEISEWPVRIAEVAMWLMDHQMNQLVSAAFGQTVFRLPLQHSPHILQGNALQLDWRTVLPPEQCHFVLGNPPFVGAKYQSEVQRGEMTKLFRCVRNGGLLDYVTAWYLKAADYIQRTPVAGAFVSTNSITQGEQVGVLWSALFPKGIQIHFAHRTVAWESESRGKAHVHVVIIGFGLSDWANKRLFDYDDDPEKPNVTVVPNISPYLVAGSNTVILNRSRPLGTVPEVGIGNKPIDGGNYLFTTEERDEFLQREPQAAKWFRRWLGSDEFINGWERWCLWLGDCPPNELRKMPEAMQRVEAVRQFRLASKSEPTRKLAATPTRFHVENMPTRNFIVVPSVSSERRRYIPIGYVGPETLISNLCFINTDVSLFHFGVLTSTMHMAWVRQVCGRLKSDYRYSAKLVYNNYPWPESPTDKNNATVAEKAQAVLDARTPFLPPNGDSTLADLYDPRSMPKSLAKAHAELDRAVDRCYRAEPFHSDRERVEHLFALYEKLTAPILPALEQRPARKSAAQKDNATPRKVRKKKGTP